MDSAIQLCLPYLRNCDSSVLCLDENTLDSVATLPDSCTIVSNRFDVAAQSDKAIFCDWDIKQGHKTGNLDCLAFRLSKEKAVNHHIINQALSVLKDGGALVFAGQKNQGIKSYAKTLKKLLGNCEIEKHGLDYLCYATVTKQDNITLLDDQDYQELRHCLEHQGFDIQSKPGQFGWNKLDQGSLLLLEALSNELKAQPAKRILDLGCGYGLLSVRVALSNDLELLIATDNNAAAVASCSANLSKVQECRGQTPLGSDPYFVIADDCAANISEKVDTVICNPPFHQGFDVENQLCDKFLKSARDHLLPSGRAYFVVNSFIGIEKKAQRFFQQVDCLVNNKQFKVLKLS